MLDKVMEMLFGAPESAKANITVGKLQEIVTMYNDLLKDYNTLKEEKETIKRETLKTAEPSINGTWVGETGENVVTYDEICNNTVDELYVRIATKDLKHILDDNESYRKDKTLLRVRLRDLSSDLDKANKAINALRKDSLNVALRNIQQVDMSNLPDALRGLHVNHKV